MSVVGSALLASLATGLLLAGQPITGIHLYDIKPGANTIPAFAFDGRPATIFQAWRGNGNAHGHNLFVVTLPNAEGFPLGVVEVADPDPFQDAAPKEVITDNPFDGERVLGVVRFARATLNGVSQSMLIRADLDQSSSGVLADHATATIRVYKLGRADGPGTTPDFFQLAFSTRTTARFCNAELALSKTLGVPLSSDYQGPNKRDGCFDAPSRRWP